jgi:hypothetical protein
MGLRRGWSPACRKGECHAEKVAVAGHLGAGMAERRVDMARPGFIVIARDKGVGLDPERGSVGLRARGWTSSRRWVARTRPATGQFRRACSGHPLRDIDLLGRGHPVTPGAGQGVLEALVDGPDCVSYPVLLSVSGTVQA